jgi:hypothetical protein
MNTNAVSWTQVQEILHAPSDVSEALLQMMRNKLADAKWVKANVRDRLNNPTFDFTFNGTLTPGDKQKIINDYTAAGWGLVSCNNSDEAGERPGMCGVTISRLGPNKPSVTSD